MMRGGGQYPRIPHLRAVPSTGPVVEDVDGQPESTGTPCGGCQRRTVEGELVTKYRGTWWHLSCADRDAAAGHPEQAWLALAHDLARSPRAYGVRETRAIMGAVLGLLQAAQLDPDEFDPDDDLGGRPA